MLKSNNIEAIGLIRRYLDEVGYVHINTRLIPGLFPEFTDFQGRARGLQAAHRFLLTLLRQGHASDAIHCQEVLSVEVFEAMVSTGLLVENRRGHFRTPGLTLVPIQGLIIAASIPPFSPVHQDSAQSAYLGDDSIWMASVLPASLEGQRVLDLCSGTGLLGLLCASRGAERVVGLECSEIAVSVAQFNAALNGLSKRVELRVSDLYSGRRVGEDFSYLVCNPPSLPGPAEVQFAKSVAGGTDGTCVIERVFGEMTTSLAAIAEASVFCPAFGGPRAIPLVQDVIAPFAEASGIRCHAYVMDKIPLTSEDPRGTRVGRAQCVYLNALSEREQEAVLRSWREELELRGGFTHYYVQHVRLWRRPGQGGRCEYWPFYSPRVTDPLMRQTEVSKFHS